MNIFDFISLFGGLALFLYGMRLMGDGLQQGSSGALKKFMEKVANNPLTDDPLAPPTAAMRATTVSNLPHVTLSGVINMGNVSLALIGGEEFGVGDQIPETGETVKAITNDAVTLFAPDTGLTRTLEVEDTDPTLSDLTNRPAQPAI